MTHIYSQCFGAVEMEPHQFPKGTRKSSLAESSPYPLFLSFPQK